MASEDTVKRYDCTSGGSKFCQGCYTMTECEYGDYVAWEDFDAMRERAEKAELALKELRSMFPVKLDKQAFVVNGGEPLRADGDDEFYSATKVNHALAEILQRIDAALAQQEKP